MLLKAIVSSFAVLLSDFLSPLRVDAVCVIPILIIGVIQYASH